MANTKFVHSHGDPYFAFVSQFVCDASTAPLYGLVNVQARVRVRKLPTQLSSSNELHPFFSLNHQFSASLPPVVELGITPAGAISATFSSGSTYETAAGEVNPSNDFITISLDYDYSSGDVTGLSGTSIIPETYGAEYTAPMFAVVPVGSGSTPGVVFPNPGYNIEAIFFNGKSGISRTDIDIEKVSVTFAYNSTGTQYSRLTWDFNDTYGNSLEATLLNVNQPDTRTLSKDYPAIAQYRDPFWSRPWGMIDFSTPSGGSYEWGLETDYTQIDKPTTTYTRVPL